MGNKNSAFETKLKAKEWQWELGREAKHLDKEIAKIQKDEVKLQEKIREQAAKGNVQAVQLLAQSVVKTRKAVQRLEKTKASMEAVKLQLTTHMASISTSQSIRLSSDIMKKMNTIARIPEISETMKDMREQMAMCADAEDSIEDALREDGEENEAAVEVQRVLEEMALDQMGPLARSSDPQAAVPATPAAPETEKKQLIAVGEEDFVKKPAAAAPAAAAPPAAPAAPPAAPAPRPVDDVTSKASPAGYAGDKVEDTDPSPAVAPAVAPVAPPVAPAPGSDDDLMRRLEMLKKP